MAAFDQSKDEKLENLVIEGDKDSFIEVSLVRYDGGEKKIQLSRFIESESEDGGTDQRSYRKLGRMSLAEAKEVALKITAILISEGTDAAG